MNFTAIDFETANSSRGSACAVGLCTVQDGKIVRCEQRFIRPEPLYFSPFNISIHGITETDVADAPAFAELWPEMLASISGPLVAHNASFDISVIRRSLDDAGLEYPDLDYYCTRVMAKLAWPGMPTYGLDHMAQHIGLSFQHHNAQKTPKHALLWRWRPAAFAAPQICGNWMSHLSSLRDAYTRVDTRRAMDEAKTQRSEVAARISCEPPMSQPP